jgi:hypothetical protein
MTEHELVETDGVVLAGGQHDGVMQRLAKLLAQAAAPPDSRERLKQALVRGDFAEMFESGSAAG